MNAYLESYNDIVTAVYAMRWLLLALIVSVVVAMVVTAVLEDKSGEQDA